MALSKRKTFVVTQSCGNFNIFENKQHTPQQTCSSEPFLKPRMNAHKVLVGWRQLVLHYLPKKQNNTHLPDVSSRVLLKAAYLNVQLSKPAVIPAVKNEEVGGRDKEMKGKIVAPEFILLSQTTNTSGLPSLTTLSDKIRLDTKTANPFLRISNDRRRLRSYTYEESQTFMKKYWFELARQKYDGWLCIQAEEGFSSGQHYWEVDVRGIRDWRIGVMRESAPKKGFAKLNTSTGYWTLRLQLGNLVALTEPVTKLNISTPSRIGVCLDMQAGKVTFYDVNKKMKRKIYRFKADFSNSEKVYPVFGTVDTKKEMVII